MWSGMILKYYWQYHIFLCVCINICVASLELTIQADLELKDLSAPAS